ncbi:type II toxin-antitoxin system RelE/ParE family toxin [Serratia marcescens]|nr:type II toxin-antitoxin system RelE/ParE family toxin [Serratia marcescens]
MTDIYLTKAFQTFAGDERISDATIVKAAREMQNQLYDANLGGCVYKKRIARMGSGKRRGYRVLIATADEGSFSCMALPKTKETTSIRMS